MVPTAPGGSLHHLRRAIASIEKLGDFSFETEGGLAFGLPEIDAVLGGGLAQPGLHELSPAVPAQIGAATGFALALAALRADERPALFIQTDFAALEAGLPYGPGLDGFGLPMERLLVLRVPQPIDVLWAFEEALKSRSLSIVIAEFTETGAAADLTATRRLSLAARAGGGLGLLLRHRVSPLASAVATRWEIKAAPSVPDRFGGLGHTAFDLSLTRNRRGRCGRFLLCWNHHERIFTPQALSVGVAAAAFDGSADPQPLARTG